MMCEPNIIGCASIVISFASRSSKSINVTLQPNFPLLKLRPSMRALKKYSEDEMRQQKKSMTMLTSLIKIVQSHTQIHPFPLWEKAESHIWDDELFWFFDCFPLFIPILLECFPLWIQKVVSMTEIETVSSFLSSIISLSFCWVLFLGYRIDCSPTKVTTEPKIDFQECCSFFGNKSARFLFLWFLKVITR